VRHREGDAAISDGGAETEVAVRTSPPLLEMLRVVDKVSQNVHAEIMLREVARARRGFGSRQGGLEELKSFLSEVGVNGDGYSINDGSGLSRLNLLTPETVTKLLVYMAKSQFRDAWIGLLPVAGEDGTIGSRFTGTPAAGRVHAKTGTLSHASALSGYIEGKDGRLLAFSIFVNNYHSESREVRGVMDQIVNLLVLDRTPGDSPVGGLVSTPDGGIGRPGSAPPSGASR
jgi:D-alanyl-D-alanine carboxypeptidase/D-alanyl-D-alanine-endopeptidase (penicillin-binding protein 4)